MSEARQILETIIDDFSIDKFSRFFRKKSRQFAERTENYSHYNDEWFTSSTPDSRRNPHHRRRG